MDQRYTAISKMGGEDIPPDQISLEDAYTRGILAGIAQRIRQHKWADRAVFFGLVVLGGFLASWGSLGADGFVWPPSRWVAVAVLGIGLSAIGAIYFHLTTDKTDHLEKSFESIRALQAARQEAEINDSAAEYYFGRSIQLRALYMTYHSARSVLEKALVSVEPEEGDLLEVLMKVLRTDLRMALGFEMSHTWTIVIYRSEVDEADGETYLRCIAHDRSIDCELTNARRWKEGVGVAGMALAKDDEVVAPDITDPAAGSLFSLNGDIIRADDRKKYRSMFAVPVRVGDDDSPWGVVLASSDQKDHFVAPEHSSDAAQGDRTEAMRALAGLVALGVAICRRNGRNGKGGSIATGGDDGTSKDE